ncbi:B9 domain-containing protein 1-like protein, partial [Operophtera brumata]
MREGELTKFLISFSGQIEYVTFPSGVFDEFLYFQYDFVWGPDWEPVSGLSSGTSQMARAGNDPEKVFFNMPRGLAAGLRAGSAAPHHGRPRDHLVLNPATGVHVAWRVASVDHWQ